MPIYEFYSRQNGYIGGIPLKHYISQGIYDQNDESNIFVDCSGAEIAKRINEISDQSLKENILVLAKKFPNWYYYKKNTNMFDSRIYT